MTARYAGSHARDDELMDFSAAATDRQAAVLRDASHALSAVDDDELDPEDRVDHAQLSTAVDRRLFELTEVRGHEWDPLVHNPGPLFHALIGREFAPPPSGWSHWRPGWRRCRTRWPARSMLRDSPAIHVETAIGQFAGVAALVRDEVPACWPRSRAWSRSGGGRRRSLAALGEFESAGWAALKGPGRDPRLGRRLWEGKLWYTLDTELTATQVLARRGASTWLRPPPSCVDLCGGVPVRQALAASATSGRTRHDPRSWRGRRRRGDGVRRGARPRLAGGRPLVIREMPEFDRGVAVAYCQPAGPFETAECRPCSRSRRPRRAGRPERVESFYREYNDHMVCRPDRARGRCRATTCSSPTRGGSAAPAGARVRCASRGVRRGLGSVRRGADGRRGFGGPAVSKLTQSRCGSA